MSKEDSLVQIVLARRNARFDLRIESGTLIVEYLPQAPMVCYDIAEDQCVIRCSTDADCKSLVSRY